tara:strand:+ start:755 stop:1375 length:621 start_codon:yes stop_codon:yes gene_type:complete
MSILAAVLAASVGPAMEFGASFIGGPGRLKRRDAAKSAYDTAMSDYTSQDFSNVFSNMENPYEDLTVNQTAAQFQQQSQSQNLADIMASGRQSAGGSGIAAFSQMLANQQARGSQQIAAQLGLQESNIQGMKARGAESIQRLERQGELTSRQMKGEMLGTKLGMSQAELAGAYQAINMAQASRAGALGEIGGGVAPIIADPDKYTS